MADQADKVEGQEPVGPQILDLYLSYLHENADHLPIEAKKALRACCKKFKYFFDASIDDAAVVYRADRFRADFKGKFLQFEVRNVKASGDIPKSFKSLDLTCRMLSSLKALSVETRTMYPLEEILPESIGQLTCLTQLKVEISSDWNLPPSFSQLTLLESLTLDTSPTSFQFLRPLMGLKALVYLFIQVRNNELTGLADFLLSFPKLKSLNLVGLGGNAAAISENFGRLQLTSLVLRFINISSLTESLGEMPSLLSLDLRVIQGLKHLPASLGNLTGLTSLALCCVELTAVPDSIGNLKHLKLMNIFDCINLPELPSSIGELESLEFLKLTECKALTELPDSVANLKSLKSLWLEECASLLALPDSLTRLTLDLLMINRCEQLVEPPVETLLHQYGTVLTYVSIKRGLTILRGEIINYEDREQSSEWETDEDNDSNVSGSQAEGDDEEESE